MNELTQLRDILRFITKHGDTRPRREWAEDIYKISPAIRLKKIVHYITIAERYLPDDKEANQAN